MIYIIKHICKINNICIIINVINNIIKHIKRMTFKNNHNKHVTMCNTNTNNNINNNDNSNIVIIMSYDRSSQKFLMQ